MSHDYHGDLDGFPDAILYDGCEECEARAEKGLSGLLDLDSANLGLLWRRCVNEEYGGSVEQNDAGRYRSACEAKLGWQLYLVGVLTERFENEAELDKRPWRLSRFGSGWGRYRA